MVGACAEGPFLWVVLARGFRNTPALVLLDWSRHTVSGVMPLPIGVRGIRVDDGHVWLGVSVWPQTGLVCVDKAKIYAALNLAPPADPTRPPRPAAFEEGDSAFYTAILRGDTATVRALLDGGASVDGSFGPGKASVLNVAVWTGDQVMCRLLIERGAAVNPARPGGGWTPLETAAAQGNPAILRMLLESKAIPTETALAIALRADDFAAVECLRQAGAPAGQLAAILTGERNESLARQLLASPLPLSPPDRAQLSILTKAADVALPPGTDAPQAAALIMQALKEMRADQAAKLVGMVPADQLGDKAMIPVVWSAIHGGFTRTLDAFLDRGYVPEPSNDGDGSGLGKLLNYTFTQPDEFSSLLRHGADPRASGKPPEALAERVAASPCAVANLPLLLKSCVTLNSSQGYGTFGGTLLCAAAGGGLQYTVTDGVYGPLRDYATPAVQWLLDHGVAPACTGREGFNALHAAFARAAVAPACLLAGLGVDLEARDLAGRTIFDAPYPPAQEQSDFIQSLRTYAPVSDLEARGRKRLLDAIDVRGQYANLLEAVSGNDITRARELLAKGVSVAPPYPGYTPSGLQIRQPGLVFLATKNRSREMAALLLDHHGDPNLGEAGYQYPLRPGSVQVDGSGQAVGESERRLPVRRCKTPLIMAAEAGDRAMVDLLLDRGAYAPATDEFQRTAVDAAATPELSAHIKERSWLQFEAQTLVSALKNINPGDSPESENYKTFDRIKTEAPEAFTTPDLLGDTPIALLTRGLDLLHPSWELMMLPSVNLDGRAAKVLTELRQAGIRLDCLDRFGTTPLHRAVVYASARTVAELVKIGFDPTFPDRRGITPLDLANRISDPKQRTEVQAALLSARPPGSMPSGAGD